MQADVLSPRAHSDVRARWTTIVRFMLGACFPEIQEARLPGPTGAFEQHNQCVRVHGHMHALPQQGQEVLTVVAPTALPTRYR